ncbi:MULTISPECIES: sigma-70 family RNA polymerase sigma factor [Actinosynnema]|uniref:sigma-70 family RNA polymerase sigma factor n=1 Tax=Actinosynnema TaxID=40566 RepID=UPI0020A2E24D|nr:sigma-70 family RNA polymerase sigma factor [Actinosynnema pretiosum]MCP2098519.1 RNA polymerase sigma factor, sigma-70 family [Actinosynnema pretiosum]
MDSLVDAQVVLAAQAGDPDAVRELVSSALPLVHNVVARALPGDADAEDVAQETMIRVVRHVGDLKDPERFRAWLVTTTIRQVRDHVRGRRPALPLDELPEPAAPGQDLAERTANRMGQVAESREVLDATRWLAPADRELFSLWWQEVNGLLSRAEVAGALRLSVPHTAVRVQRMKERLLLARTALRAWRAVPRCPELSACGGVDGGDRWFKRATKHVRGCARCLDVGAPRFPAEYFAAQAGLLLVPAGLQAAVSALPQGVAPPAGGALKAVAGYASGKPLAAALPAAGLITAVALAVYLIPLPGQPDPPTELALPTATAPSIVDTPSGAPPTSSSAPPTTATPISFFVSPKGDDGATGTEQDPFATLGRAAAVAQPGQTIYLKDGIHRPTEAVELTASGTPDKPITLAAAPGDHVILDASQVGARPMLTVRGAHWVVRDLEIIKGPAGAVACISCGGSTFQRLSLHDNLGTGLAFSGSASGNLVLDGDFHHNRDAEGREADGIAFTTGSGDGNTVRGCRAYDNVDDGISLGAFTGKVTLDSNWAYGNGINRWGFPRALGSGHGFDLGTGGPHAVLRSAAWKNNGDGFTSTGRAGHELSGSSAFRNAGDGFALRDAPARLRDNLALGNREQALLGDGAVAQGNTWNERGWGGDVLREVDPASAEGERRADGSLPATSFLVNTKDPRVGAPMTGAG